MHDDRWRLLAVLSLAGFLLGADGTGCPMLDGKPQEEATAQGASVLDLGGPEGTPWDVTFDSSLRLTLRLGDEVASIQTDDQRAPVQLLGQPLDPASFCWRPDVACPQHILGAETVVANDSQGAVALTITGRGPLAAIRQGAVQGRIEGHELSLGLPTADEATGICALRSPAAIIATASSEVPDEAQQEGDEDSEGADGLVARQLHGKITVSYDGLCLMASGAAAVSADALLELSAGFTALRR